MHSWLEINTKNLTHNIAQLKKFSSPRTKLMAVIKGNAYGHGLLEVGKAIAEDVDYLGIYDLNDALLLRKNKIKTPILMLGRTFASEVSQVIKNNIDITVTTFDLLEAIAKIKTKPMIHLGIDTGIGRDGFNHNDLEKVAKFIKEKNIAVKGIYMHFSAAEEKLSDDYSKNQINNFLQWKKTIKAEIYHVSASSGLLMKNFGHEFDMVRTGTAMYGMWTSDDIYERFKNKIKLRPVLSLKTKIVEIKSMSKGDSIAYNRTHKLTRDSKIAILPLGYFDGISRIASGKIEVLIKEKRCKQLGRVMMNMLVIDVTDVKNLKVGDIATVIGKDGKEIITAEECAIWGQTSNLEVTTRLSALLPRQIIQNKTAKNHN
jgi:alanine racemase